MTLNTAVNASPQPIHPFATLYAFSMRPIVHGDIFLETLFFCQRVAYSLACERRGLVNGHCITLMWARCYSSRPLECETKLSAWNSASVALPLIFQSRVGCCCHAPSPILAGAKEGSQAPLQVFNPHICVPESLCLCWIRVRLVFWGTRERWLLLSFSFAEAVSLHRQVWFLHASLKSGWVRVYAEKPQDQSVLHWI